MLAAGTRAEEKGAVEMGRVTWHDSGLWTRNRADRCGSFELEWNHRACAVAEGMGVI